MKINNLIYLVIIVIFTITGCKKSDNDPFERNDVYVAGNERGLPTIWKNGVATTLKSTASSTFSAVGSIAVNNADVYTAGYYTEKNQYFTSNACYWKNSVFTKLRDSAVANDIAIKDNDIYIVGSYYDSGLNNSTACYWKNGIFTSLQNIPNVMVASALRIAIKGNDVYIVGYARNTTGSSSIPVYWKNGNIAVLASNGLSTEAYGVAVNDNNDVFIAGRAQRPPNSVGQSQGYAAVIWKNGTYTKMEDDLSLNAFNIAVKGNDVYAVGEAVPSSVAYWNAVYWKNYSLVKLTDNSSKALASSIAIQNNDIYISGISTFGSLNDDDYKACYWKNGIVTKLSNDASKASDIAVVPRK